MSCQSEVHRGKSLENVFWGVDYFTGNKDFNQIKLERRNAMSETKLNEALRVVATAAAASTDDCWLTIPEAAAIASMKPNTMYTCCLRRILPSYKIGEKMRRIKKSDLIAWMESSRVEAR
jgi:excisionase family DNA binding protein